MARPATLAERLDLALDWQGRGFGAVKFAPAVAEEGAEAEMVALRRALGPGTRTACAMHWQHTALAPTRLIDRMHAHDLWFAEAPVAPEDIEGQRKVAGKARTSIALGEEWRTAFEYRPRMIGRCMDIIQPEMAHTGVTEFMKIGRMAEAFHCRIIPHASIGIFQAASLHASVALQTCDGHEDQHSIIDRNLRFLEGDIACAAGVYHLPSGPGLGVSPSPEVWRHATRHESV